MKTSSAALLTLLSFSLSPFGHAADSPAPSPVKPAPAPSPVPAPAPAPVPVKERLEKLQGVWEGVEVGHEEDGKCAVTIVGDTMHFQRARGSAWHKGVIEFPTGTGPQMMRVNIKESSNSLYAGKGASLLYQLQPDGSLMLAGGPPGETYDPKGFGLDEHSRRFVLKKVVPKTPAPPAN